MGARIAISALLMLVCLRAPLAGPFEDGLAAADNGDYETALSLWQPLAEQGDAAAQFNIGVLYANDFKDDARAIEWFMRAMKDQYFRAKAQLGVARAHIRQGNYKEALRWAEIPLRDLNPKSSPNSKTEQQKREEQRNIETWHEALELVQYLYADAQFFPPPLPGWRTEGTKTSVDQNFAPLDFLAGEIYLLVESEQIYEEEGSGKKISIGIVVNNFALYSIMATLYDDLGGEAADPGEKQKWADLREKLINDGVAYYSYQSYQGWQSNLGDESVMSKVVGLSRTGKWSQSLFVAFIGDDEAAIQAYQDKTDLARIKDILEGAGFEPEEAAAE